MSQCLWKGQLCITRNGNPYQVFPQKKVPQAFMVCGTFFIAKKLSLLGILLLLQVFQSYPGGFNNERGKGTVRPPIAASTCSITWLGKRMDLFVLVGDFGIFLGMRNCFIVSPYYK